MKYEINLPGPGGWASVSAAAGIGVHETKEGTLILVLPRDRWREVGTVAATPPVAVQPTLPATPAAAPSPVATTIVAKASGVAGRP